MTGNISLTEYNELVENLDFVPPFEKCSESGDMKVIIVEPSEGRNILGVDRNCIIQCSECGKRYVSNWY